MQEPEILILAYYFPPSNSTASDRTYFWLKYLLEAKMKTTVICKDWGSIKHLSEKPSIQQVKLEDRPLKRIGTTSGIRKIYKQFSPIIEPLWLLQGEKKLLDAASQFISTRKNVVLITSSSPYSLFKIGYELKQRHPHISWIADYRDEWSSRELANFDIPIISNVLIWCTSLLEKKWISKADAFTTVSTVLCGRISSVHKEKIRGYVVENGYDYLREKNVPTDHQQVHFAYTGNVYKVQDFERSLTEIDRVAQEYPQIKTIVSFVGGAISDRRRSIMNKTATHIDLRFVDHMKRADLDVFNESADVFLMASYGNIKGYQSSKIYYYISMKKPVFLCPSDNDVMEEILTDSGIKLENLHSIYKAKISATPYQQHIASDAYLHKYSREAGTQKLRQVISETEHSLFNSVTE